MAAGMAEAQATPLASVPAGRPGVLGTSYWV